MLIFRISTVQNPIHLKYLLVLIGLLLPFFVFGQLLRMQTDEQGVRQIDTLSVSFQTIETRNTFRQLEGFPKGFVANSTFKNFRNVTLADLDGDGVEDILIGANDKLFAFNVKGLLWEKQLEGVALYPAAVADVDGDGNLEIAQNTGGVGVPGRLYLLKHTGENYNASFPLSFDDHWMVSAPSLSDLDGDGQMEILIGELIGNRLHVLNLNGEPFNNNFPQNLGNSPAVTPSIGDVDGDGEKEIVCFSSRAQYVFEQDGTILNGYPIDIEAQNMRHSYQSPILADLNEDGKLDIIAATHGDQPEYFVRDGEGNYLSGWPQKVSDSNWTYSTPSLMHTETNDHIFMGRSGGSVRSTSLSGWDASANVLTGFPIEKIGGSEGIIAIADVDGDGEAELILDSNVFDSQTQQGFIHAYEMDGQTEVAGFPIRPHGWTYMNGANIGDVNGDGMMDAVVLTYTQGVVDQADSIFLHAYDLGVPYTTDRVWWTTYKGSNDRAGNFGRVISSTETTRADHDLFFTISPNPINSFFQVKSEEPIQQVILYNSIGQVVKQFDGNQQQHEIEAMLRGLYYVRVQYSNGSYSIAKPLVVLNN